MTKQFIVPYLKGTKARNLFFLELHSDKTDLVGQVKGVLILGKSDVSLLLSIGSVEGVDASDLDVVDLLESISDLGLSGLMINDEDHSILVFDLFHGLFGVYGVSDDGVLVESKLNGVKIGGISLIFGISSQSQSSGSVESDLFIDLVGSGLMFTLSVGLGDLLGSLSSLGGSTGVLVTLSHCIALDFLFT